MTQVDAAETVQPVAYLSEQMLDLLKVGTEGAYNGQISNVKFSRFTVPLYAAPVASPPMQETFQQEVDRWLIACFGEAIARDKIERNHRFLEEALELVQSGGCTASEAHQLVDYVYGRPVGEMPQEVGGVMNTLAALCLAYGLDMVECGNVEIARCWTKVEKIRAKQAAKPKHSPLPEHVASPSREEVQITDAMVELAEHAYVNDMCDGYPRKECIRSALYAALRSLQSGEGE